jgi:hypothetical protein
MSDRNFCELRNGGDEFWGRNEDVRLLNLESRIGSSDSGFGLIADCIVSPLHFPQLSAESPPTQASKNYDQENEKYRYAAESNIYLLIAVFVTSLCALRIAKGLNRGGYSGSGITLLGLPLLTVYVRSFLYGFLNLTLP